MTAAAALCLTLAPLAQAQSPAVHVSAVQTRAGEAPLEVLSGKAKLTGHFDPQQMLRLVIGLQHPHMAEEEQFLRDLQSPKSPEFRKFMTPEQWTARFSPSAEDEKAVLDWAASQGLTVTHRYPNRLLVNLEA
ncbi:MAG: protease pro-enzyme activation domain-containing protein, partial [Terriglobales bacterium]